MSQQILASVASNLSLTGALSVMSLCLTMPPPWTGSLWCTAGISSCPQVELLLDTMLPAGYIPWVVPILVFAELLITRGGAQACMQKQRRLKHPRMNEKLRSRNKSSEPHAGES